MVTNNNGVLVGLSTDTKPTGYDNGTKFEEMDTGKVYRYDIAGKVWVCPSTLVTAIAVKTAPTKTAYIVGEYFSPTGLVLTATYGDGSTKDITSGYTYSPNGPLAGTDTAITITYSGKTCTQAITVATLSSIAITTPPTKTAYTVGETFDPTGMVVTATYSDESTAVVTTYAYAPMEALTAEDTTITVTYEGKTATQAITVT